MRTITTTYRLLTTTALVLAATPALADASTQVSLGWGDVVSTVLTSYLVPAAGVALAGVLIAILPAPIKVFFDSQRTAQVEQLLERALGYGAAQVAAAVKGQTLTVDVQNKIVQSALQYAIDHGSAALINWMGGAAGGTKADNAVIAQKLTARVLTSPAVNAAVNGGTSVTTTANPV
jgi:hypothetical protein